MVIVDDSVDFSLFLKLNTKHKSLHLRQILEEGDSKSNSNVNEIATHKDNEFRHKQNLLKNGEKII